MNSRLASVRTGGGLDRVDRAVQLLEDEWRRHGEVQLENFWSQQQRTDDAGPGDSLGMLAALVKADLRRRFDLGETPAVAGYLERFPELRTADSRVLSLVYEEFCLNEERGTTPDVESFCDRYPDWKSSLASQLRYHRLISQAAGGSPPLPRFPKPGEDFEEFHLLSLLGRGGTSRVFLAKDRSLGGKQVALKVTLDRGQEPNVQGPLDHPHIVPVNSVCYQKEGRLCGLSMPFQPGLPLDEIIKRVKPAARPHDAMAFWRVLTDGTAGDGSDSGRGTVSRQPGPRGDGWEEFPVRKAYHHGAAWIVMMVARALDYAHGKETYHRDVKPANVLLTLTDGPQLLDFNLAEAPHSCDHAQAAMHGGTLPYMAPEQIEAFLNPELWGKVGARADIYSLGFVLRELLTGQTPEAPEEKVPPARAMRDLLDRRSLVDTAVRRVNPAIPHSLEAIVAKCLTVSPADRYPDAGALARDLDRFLKHQPLLEANNPSRRERAGNWLTRQRRALVAVACTIGFAGILYAAALFTPRNQVPMSSVESHPDFVKAVKLFDEGESGPAVMILADLVKAKPQSCLGELYLAFALRENPDTERGSGQWLRRALASPKSSERLTAWAHDHPDVVSNLVDFVEARIIRADELVEKFDREDLDDDERNGELRADAYDLAREALTLAVKLDPDSPTIQRLLATTELVFGDYASAHAKLTQLTTPPGSNGLKINELIFCHELRGRAAFLWVEKLRTEKARLDNGTVQFLVEAIEDLDVCYRAQVNEPFTKGRERKEYRIVNDKARATLTLAEVETDLEASSDAESHLIASQKLISKLQALSDGNSAKLPPPQRLQKRLGIDRKRLVLGQGMASTRSPKNGSSPPAKTSSHSG